MKIHLFEDIKNFSREDKSSQDWKSGHWKLSKKLLQRLVDESADIYFHSKLAEPSYFGGVVTGYEPTDHPDYIDQERYIIHFTADMAHKGIVTGKEGWHFWYKIEED
jgi:hypothetical protein